ncbi:MAG: 4Fe-4S dicluster domain-containing protein [Burkholderiaceae bacterium]
MKLGLVIDMDTCVGCHACAVACKEWNGASLMAGGAPDYEPYGDQPSGVWFNRIRHFEVRDEATRDAATGHFNLSKTVNVPMSCMHCEDADCVTVCPTGASYKRAEDGIVLVDPERCMGCNYCAWACPYGARELDREEGVMRKCTLCVDRIYDQALPEAERQPACVLACPAHARHFGDFDDPASKVSTLVAEREGAPLLPQLDYKPVNRYLPPREAPVVDTAAVAAAAPTLKERLAKMVNRVVSI